MEANKFIEQRDSQKGASWSTDNDELASALDDYATLKIAENYQNIVGKTKKTPGRGVDAHAEIIQMLVKALTKDKTGQLEMKVRLLLKDYKETIKNISDHPDQTLYPTIVAPNFPPQNRVFDLNSLNWREIQNNRRQMSNSLITSLENRRDEQARNTGYSDENFRHDVYLAFDTRSVIRLIKAIRAYTGFGLREAKVFAEQFLMEDLNEDPENEIPRASQPVGISTPSSYYPGTPLAADVHAVTSARLRETEPEDIAWNFNTVQLADDLHIVQEERSNFFQEINRAVAVHDTNLLCRTVLHYNQAGMGSDATYRYCQRLLARNIERIGTLNEIWPNHMVSANDRFETSSRFSDHAWRSIAPTSLSMELLVSAENADNFIRQVEQARREHNFVLLVRTVRDWNNTGLGLEGAKRFCESFLRQNDGWNRITPDAMIARLGENGTPVAAEGVATFIREASELIATQKKINLIKLVRIHTGLGLKEAKDFVESFFD